MYSVGSRPSDKGGVPGHHSDPEIEGDGGLKKNIFLALRFGPHFGLRIRGEGPGPLGPSPGSATDVQVLLQKVELLSTFCNKISQLATT